MRGSYYVMKLLFLEGVYSLTHKRKSFVPNYSVNGWTLYKTRLGQIFGLQENILSNLLTEQDPFLPILESKTGNSSTNSGSTGVSQTTDN